jgi:four helix bundle protein
MDLAVAVYQLSRAWPKGETYGLTSRARRAAVSVPANIAEGYGRQSTTSYAHFLKIARGSLKELETHLLLAERVDASPPSTCRSALAHADELGKMLGTMIRAVARQQ